MATSTQHNEHQLLIGGKWVDASDGTYDIINPATEEVVGQARPMPGLPRRRPRTPKPDGPPGPSRTGAL